MGLWVGTHTLKVAFYLPCMSREAQDLGDPSEMTGGPHVVLEALIGNICMSCGL